MKYKYLHFRLKSYTKRSHECVPSHGHTTYIDSMCIMNKKKNQLDIELISSNSIFAKRFPTVNWMLLLCLQILQKMNHKFWIGHRFEEKQTNKWTWNRTWTHPKQSKREKHFTLYSFRVNLNEKYTLNPTQYSIYCRQEMKEEKNQLRYKFLSFFFLIFKPIFKLYGKQIKDERRRRWKKNYLCI